MAVTAETRSGLIGLSVVMLGSAPGTDLLNEWVEASNDGASLEDIAEHIAASDAFQDLYPAFLTNEEFAKAMLDATLGGEVSEALLAAAVDIVVGILNDGTTRAQLALALMNYLGDVIAQGEDHSGYADFGGAAMALLNKFEVAEYHTVILRQSGPNSRILRDVTSEVGLDDIRANIDDYLDPSDPIYLTNLRDNIEGGPTADYIIAEPDANQRETLDSFDTIDGGGGSDTLEVYDADDLEIDVNGADVSNVENIYLSARNKIDADLSRWEGVETVTLGRFGNTDTVNLKVAGAAVETTRTFGNDVTITGAGGDLSLTATAGSAVTVNSDGITSGVSVTGGKSVTINGKDSVVAAAVSGVARDFGNDGERGASMAPVEHSTSTDAAKVYVLASDETQTTTDVSLAKMVEVEGSADSPSATINSEAISSVSVSNTEAIVAVGNAAKAAVDLALTVDKFGKHKDGAGSGELHLTGEGAAANVSINVAGDSDFSLSSSAKTLSVSGDGGLAINLDRATALESITLSGGGKVSTNVKENTAELETIDASASSGANTIGGVGGNVKSVTGGSGADVVIVTAFNDDGLQANLGGGNDRFTAGAAGDNLAKNAIDGGDGVDVLNLTVDDGSYRAPGASRDSTIYSNFEILEIGGTAAAATYDVALLGVSSVRASVNAPGTVTLANMADGMGISVHGSGGGIAATVIHSMPSRSAGDARYSGNLDVSLAANGGPTDTKTADGTTGEASLTLTADAEIEILSVSSNANAGGSRTPNPNDRPNSGHYENSLELSGSGTTIELINVDGNAQLSITGTALGGVEIVDAANNSGGVTISLTGSGEHEFIGGSGGDTFTGGSGADDMQGNGGDDTLDGGDGEDILLGGAGGDTLTGGGRSTADVFDYTSASESQVAWTARGAMYGFDTITDWDSSDKISLGKSLFESLSGTIKTSEGGNDDNGDAVGDALAFDTSLRAWLDDGDGVFESQSAGAGFGSVTTRHAIVNVTETYKDANDADVMRTWVLIDVDGDGDFNAEVDMAIALTGDLDLGQANFTA